MTHDARSRSLLSHSFALVCALYVGCGDGESSPSFSSGVNSNAEADQLDDEEKRQFCGTLDTHVSVTVGFDEIARIACLPAALLTATSRQACEELLDSCSRGTSGITVSSSERMEKCYDSLAMCQEDVGTLESCVNVNVAAVRTVLERFTCARFGDDNLERDLERVMDTAAACGQTSASCKDAVFLL